MSHTIDLDDLRLQWAALEDEDLMGLPKEALVASIKDLARELLERTESNISVGKE